MAKPRKPKNNEDPKPENSGAVVHHQKLCLSIDIDKRQVHGYTELEIAVPEIGIVGLHAENLGIESVWVDGEPTEFEYYPHRQQQAEDDKRFSSVCSPSSAADAAVSVYMSALEKELVPNLLINCCKPSKAESEQQQERQPASENGFHSSAEPKQNVRTVRIDYWIEKAETGIHFRNNLLHTDNQIRRARCWFPCIDDNSQRCCYDLEFTVAHNLVAVSTGSLLYQVLSKDNPPRKTYFYKLDVPVAARWISLAVAPFEVFPDHQFSLISHMCSPPNLSKMRNTVDFFHSAFSCYKDFLSVDFPFDSYTQVFIEPEMAVSSLSLGASMSIFSSQVLFDEKVIDQTIDTRVKLAYALARQWFGVYITPEAPNDEWLLDGLAGFLTDFFIKKHLGNNEARYRRYKENCAVCKVDNDGATALSCSASCKDLYGTQCIGLYGKIRSWKSVAVLQMLEKQMGPESFRRILQTIVSRAQDKTRSIKTLSTKEINQLEKDKDVIAQAQAIAALEASPQLSFSIVNALNNFLSDSKAFWRVRIEAAFALANSASEETDFSGLLHLVKFYKSRRFDPDIGLPKPNDFQDFAEYFVLEAIPHAVAMVRAADKKSPREAIEFVLQLLKYNDNNGNPYSDVFWLAALVQSVGELEFGQQSILLLSSLLKRIDRLLQFDSLMPSYNGILTISCIRTLTQIALKLSGFIPLDRVYELVKPFRDLKALWQVQIEASKALLDLEFHCKGMDSALLLFIKYIEEEHSLRGQLKLATHVMRLCQMRDGLNSNDEITSQTLVSMLNLLEGRIAFNNVSLRHYLFCILQILARRPPTLHGIPRGNRMLHMSLAEACNYQKNIFALDSESKPLDLPSSTKNLTQNLGPTMEGLRDAVDEAPKDQPCEASTQVHLEALKEASLEKPKEVFTEFPQEAPIEAPNPNEVSKEVDTVSNSHERKRPIKIKVKQSSATSRADTDNQVVECSLGGRNEMDHGASSSVSVDAPQRNFAETVSISNHNIDEVNSWHDRGSRMTASIGSAKFLSDGDELVKELQCTADSSIVYSQPQPEDPSSSSIIQDNNIDADARRYASLQTLSVARFDPDGESLGKEISARGKEKHKSKEKKRKQESNKGHHDDVEYLERKRLKKEKKHREKELAKLQSDEAKRSSIDLSSKKVEPVVDVARQVKSVEPSGYNSKVEIKKIDTKPEPSEGTSGAPKIRIKIKNRMLSKS
ncbi:hypothetical protein AAZV13_05G012000 [Glycine max]